MVVHGQEDDELVDEKPQFLGLPPAPYKPFGQMVKKHKLMKKKKTPRP